MSETPLRRHLARIGCTAEDFAVRHGLSPWNVRHWSRGDKLPVLETQRALVAMTGGEVTPITWLEWSMAKCTHCPNCPRRASGDIAACVEVLCPCREREAA